MSVLDTVWKIFFTFAQTSFLCVKEKRKKPHETAKQSNPIIKKNTTDVYIVAQVKSHF